MHTKLLNAKQPGAIEEAAGLLRQGHLIAFPTDTLYGVGAGVTDEAAIERLYKAKGRSREKGIPVLLADAGDLNKVAADIPEAARLLIGRYWPGPLTLVLPKRAGLPVNLSPNEAIAVRVPDNSVARRFIAAAGGAIAASSANRSGAPPARTAREASEALGDTVAAVLDGGRAVHGLASTILDCTTDPPRLLRRGPIPIDDLPLSPLKVL